MAQSFSLLMQDGKHGYTDISAQTPLPVACALAGGWATGGSQTTIVDAMKDFQAGLFKGKIAVVRLGGVDHYRKVAGAAGDTITIEALDGEAVVAGTPYIVL